MSCLVRISALCATMLVGATFAAASDGVPSPFFPPDPWEVDTVTFSATGDIPSPFFPPDPWEVDN